MSNPQTLPIDAPPPYGAGGAPTASGTRPLRNPTVEYLRYIGAAGIVWFHLNGPFAWVGHAALDVFVILSVVFPWNQNAHDRGGGFCASGGSFTGP